MLFMNHLSLQLHYVTLPSFHTQDICKPKQRFSNGV